ncbi:MAG: DNA translocase FtsK [Rhabdochlamydiaceae bacterium]
MILKKIGGFGTRTLQIDSSGTDMLLSQAEEIVKKYDKVSASLLQRKLSIGYSRAARLLDELEEKGIVSAAVGGQPRTVLNQASDSPKVS